MSIDMNRVGLLLHVITEAVGHGTNFRDIVAEANFELLAMNETARQDGLKRAKAKVEADAQAKAEAAVEADPEVDPQSDFVEPGPDATAPTSNGRRL